MTFTTAAFNVMEKYRSNLIIFPPKENNLKYM